MHPRVMIVGTVPYNTKSTSRAFDAYFHYWEKENLAQIFSNTKKPCKGHCKTLFQITDYRAVSYTHLISDGMMYVVICLLMRRWMNPLGIFCVFAVQMVLAVIWCIGAHRWYFASFPARRSAVVYDIRRGMDQLIREYGMDKKFDVQLKVHAEECVKNPDMLKGMEAVFLSGVHSHERNILLKDVYKRQVFVGASDLFSELFLGHS